MDKIIRRVVWKAPRWQDIPNSLFLQGQIRLFCQRRAGRKP